MKLIYHCSLELYFNHLIFIAAWNNKPKANLITIYFHVQVFLFPGGGAQEPAAEYWRWLRGWVFPGMDLFMIFELVFINCPWKTMKSILESRTLVGLHTGPFQQSTLILTPPAVKTSLSWSTTGSSQTATRFESTSSLKVSWGHLTWIQEQA